MKLLLRTISVLLAAAAAAPVALADRGPTMPLSQVHAGMNCTGYTVIQGTSISSFAVHIDGVVRQPGEGARILLSVSGPAVASSGIAAGFSGSPVYCSGSNGTMENIGAISEGVGQYGNTVGLATPIQQMLGEPVRPPVGAPTLHASVRALSGPLAVSGLSPVMMSLFGGAARRAGRTVVPAAAAPTSDAAPTRLVPGASVGVSYSTGVIGIGSVGTVTYRKGSNVYLFGHPLDSVGRRSLFLQGAYVYGVISNPEPIFGGSYKLAAPTQVVGTVTSDTPNAVIGQVGQSPDQIPVTASARDLNTGRTIVERSQVADESAVGYPLGGSLLDVVAPLAAGQAAIDVYNGAPASESGTMCLHIALVEHATVLHLCDRYVGIGAAGFMGYGLPEVAMGASTDVANALALLDSVQFASLHVRSVKLSIGASRGLAEALILGARAPKTVKPGQRVTVRLRIQLYRRGVRTIRVPLRIPRDATKVLPVTISGPFSPFSGPGSEGVSLVELLSGSLGGPSPFPPRPPANLSQLRSRFANVPPYDGLTARLGHSKPLHVYRDPRLLITGEASLTFKVKGAHPAPAGPSPFSPHSSRPAH